MRKGDKGNGHAGTAARVQARAARDARLEQFFRHLDSISIDMDDEELEIEATLPDDSMSFGVSSTTLSRTIDLEEDKAVRAAVRRLVEVCQERLMDDDPDYDAERCDRCVKSDCCHIERIHLREDERKRILESLDLADTPANNARFFEADDDLSGYYGSIFRHVDGHCVFLKPQKAPGGRTQMRCSIYELRPRVCREYDAGYCTEWSDLLPDSSGRPA